jgi:hypothetical protein
MAILSMIPNIHKYLGTFTDFIGGYSNSWVKMGKGFIHGISNGYLAYFKNYSVYR